MSQDDVRTGSEHSMGSYHDGSSSGAEGLAINREAFDHSYLAVISNRDGGEDHLVHEIKAEEVIKPEVRSIFNNACIIPVNVLLLEISHL